MGGGGGGFFYKGLRGGGGGGGGGVLSYKRLMGMCRWIDYNGVAFSTELLEGVARFLILG